MTADARDIPAASKDPDATLSKPVELSGEELAEARKDAEWAQFARDAETYVRETTAEAADPREQLA